jgi:hypothetical protein
MNIPTNPTQTRKLIDPRQLWATHKRRPDNGFAVRKSFYAVMIGQQVYRARRTFLSSYDATAYAERLHARWIRLYEAAIKLNPELEQNPLED